MKTLFRWVNSLGFRKKIFYINISIMLVFVCVFGVVQYYFVRHYAVEQYKYSVKHNHEQTCSLISNMTSDYSTTLDLIERNHLIDDFIRNHSFDANNPNVLYEYERYSNFKENIESITQNFEIDSFGIYTFDGYIYENDRRLHFSNEQMKQSDWYNMMSEHSLRTLYCDSSCFGTDEFVDDEYIYCVRTINSNTDYENIVGAIRLGVRKDKIEKILLSGRVTEEALSIIYNGNGDIVLSSTNSQETLSNCKGFLDQNFSKNELMVIKNNNVRYLAVFRTIQFTDWVVADFLPLNSLLESYYILMGRMFGIILVFFILIILAMNKILTSQTKRLNVLINTMRKYKVGELCAVEVENVNDDVGECVDAYNQMICSIRQMINERLKNQENQTKYNIKRLYKEINPHFLYNTLEIINNMAVKYDVDCISEMVQMLAEYYRLTLNNSSEMLSLEQEIRHSELYVDICNRRFSHNIFYCCEVPDELLTMEVPKLILQPIIENAVIHGFANCKNHDVNEILVVAYKRGEFIDIEVIDNGKGIAKEKLDKLNDFNEDSMGIGLRNIDERLKIFYGQNCGVSIESEEGKGAKVVLRVKEL